MIKIDCHTHTIASGHAFSTIHELTKVAKACGLIALGITDHGPSMDGAPTKGYFEMVNRIPRKLNGVNILMGCEANIVDTEGNLDLPESIAMQQHLVIAGLHSRTPYPSSSINDNTRALIKAIKLPYVHIISHPYRNIYPVNVKAIVDAACENNTLLEVNMAIFHRLLMNNKNSIHKDKTVLNTKTMIHQLRTYNQGFVLNSDAHIANEIEVSFDFFEEMQALLEFTKDDVLNLSLEKLSPYIPSLEDIRDH